MHQIPISWPLDLILIRFSYFRLDTGELFTKPFSTSSKKLKCQAVSLVKIIHSNVLILNSLKVMVVLEKLSFGDPPKGNESKSVALFQ